MTKLRRKWLELTCLGYHIGGPFCYRCGKETPVSYTCPHCGRDRLLVSYRFCKWCGRDIEELESE